MIPDVGYRVVVVEDDPDLADNVRELVDGVPGVTVSVCHAGAPALDIARDDGVDLAVINARLPDIGGVSLATRLRRDHPAMEFVILSGDASLDTAVAALREGAAGYLQKPFLPEDLHILVERALGQVRDRRERERLQRDLERSELLYRAVVDSVSAFVVVIDAAGVVSVCNRFGEETLELPPGGLVGTRFEQCLASGQPRVDLAAALSRLAAGRHSAPLELPLRNGRLVRWRLSPFMLDAEAARGVLAMGEDLSDRRELERRAVEAESLASVGQLTAGLAHEIRNPLNAASLQLELIKRGLPKLDAPTRRLSDRVGVVELELSRLTALLNDFLNLARPKMMAREPVDMGRLFADVIELQQAAAAQHGVSISQHVDDAAGSGLGDPDALKQVLINLVVNALDAVRATGEGGEIVLTARPEHGRVVVGVHDTGPGIAEEVAGRLFEPFVTSKEAGTGLGLTVVRRIVDRHGGTIRAARDDEGRTLIRFTLDAAPA